MSITPDSIPTGDTHSPRVRRFVPVAEYIPLVDRTLQTLAWNGGKFTAYELTQHLRFIYPTLDLIHETVRLVLADRAELFGIGVIGTRDYGGATAQLWGPQ